MFQTERKTMILILIIMKKLSEDLIIAIRNSKLTNHRRIASKLNHPKLAPKTYWSILKLFVNGKKIPLKFTSATKVFFVIK